MDATTKQVLVVDEDPELPSKVAVVSDSAAVGFPSELLYWDLSHLYFGLARLVF